MGDDSEFDDDDRWQCRRAAAAQLFGDMLDELHRSNPWPDQPLLPQALNDLMTELWDRGFSQTEIREAFEKAVADLPRYAADEEARFGRGPGNGH